MLIIPFNSTPFRTFTTTLNGAKYQFATNYNDRNGVWSFDLADGVTGNPLASGVPILLGCDLLAPYGLGIGSLYAVDLAATPAAALVTLTAYQAALKNAATSSVAPVLQSTDADPLGAFNDDLGNRVVVAYLAPGETIT